tara:strand:- start:367 stop:1101 length:735 start_codon:yes stop_codon:yes gene_type:complete
MEALYIIILIVSVLLGGLIVSILDTNKNKKTSKLFLAFSGGFLLSISFIDFIPHLYENNSSNISYYILCGFLIQLVLEYFSKGIEHGHTHIEKRNIFPLAIFISLCLHSILEGIPLGTETLHTDIHHHHKNAQNLFLGIVFHQVPVSIALMSILITSKLSKSKSWIYLALFSITTPLGMLLGLYIPESIFVFDESIILAIVVGIFLHISTTIIFETNENHKFNFIKLITILLGFGLALSCSSLQ